MIEIVIDGKYRIVEEGLTLLEAAKVCGVEIPSLCGMNKSNEKIPCDLCVVEVEVAELSAPVISKCTAVSMSSHNQNN